jgi:CP family cyanate transporter-like MFS transporter
LLAGVAVLPWLGLVRHDRPLDPDPSTRTIGLGDVARTRLGWTMAMFFGLQSLQAYSIFGWFAEVYQDAGYPAHTAGLMLGVITGISIPLSFVIPALAARMTNQAPLMWVLMCCYPIGYLGLIFAPYAGAVIWAVVIGIGTCTFPLILTLIGLRAHTPAGTAALSGFTQSTGYLIAAIGPFGVGLLHDSTGGWTVPLIALTLVAIPQLAFGLAVAKPSYLEDQLPKERGETGLRLGGPPRGPSGR